MGLMHDAPWRSPHNRAELLFRRAGCGPPTFRFGKKDPEYRRHDADGPIFTDAHLPNTAPAIPFCRRMEEFIVLADIQRGTIGRAAGVSCGFTNRGHPPIHGSAWEYIRNKRIDTTITSRARSGPPFLSQHQYGGRFRWAGILPQILTAAANFFFVAYEHLQKYIKRTPNVPIHCQRSTDRRLLGLLPRDPHRLQRDFLRYPGNIVPASQIETSRRRTPLVCNAPANHRMASPLSFEPPDDGNQVK